MKSGSVKTLLKILFGLGIGVINGFFGGGGGMLCVPFLEGVLKKPAKTAHATAILVILPVTAVSALVYILNGGFDFRVGGFAGGGVVLGGLLGAILLSKMSNAAVRLIFALVMILLGLKMIG